jgi:hypothetical protein
VVVLHIMDRPGKGLPNLSPYVVKLETFLRLEKFKKIWKYMNFHGALCSSASGTPPNVTYIAYYIAKTMHTFFKIERLGRSKYSFAILLTMCLH